MSLWVKMLRKTMFLIIFSGIAVKTVFAGAVEKNIFPIEIKIRSVKQNKRTGKIYAAGKGGIYSVNEYGVEKEEIPAGIKEVIDMCFTRDLIYFISKGRIYLKDTEDMDARWRTIPFDGRAKGITAYDGRGNKAVLWTEKDIYMVEPSGVEKIKINAGENTNIKVASGEKYLFLLTDKNCMMMDKSTKRWKSIMNFDWNIYSEKSEDEEHNTGVEVCRAYMAPDKDKLLIYVSSQLYLYNINTGSRETFNITGISAASINCIDLSGTIPIIASGNDLFLIRGSKGYPEVLFSAEGQYAISALYACCREKNMTVWAGAGNILYKVKIEPENNGYVNSGITAADIVSVKEVQRMAIAYAEVDPKKIDNWRKAAKIKAILPKVSFDISESDDGNVEIYKSATKYYIVNGPREIDRDWSVGLSWDLSDLIWNDAQTNIDVRSKLMVQMRNDILEEVTRLYFERIRLESELLDLAESSDKDRDIRLKKIRIEEITAYIDAYTGGGFSSKILSKKK